MIRYIFSLLILFISSAGAQSPNISKLDSLFNILSGHNKAMGSIAVSKNGKLLYSKSIGYCNYESEQSNMPATSTTKYRIASISKMYTAVMILQLESEGKLKLTDKLKKYFPKIPNAKKITIAHLLNHHSGLHEFTSDPYFIHLNTGHKTQKEMLEIIASSGTDFEPGSNADYCNSNYILLGYIVEKICRKPYAEVLRERITSRLALQHTYPATKTNKAANEASSYFYLSKWRPLPETDCSILAGAGAILSTPEELNIFIDALFAGKLLSEQSLRKMTTITDGYGMGIFLTPVKDKMAYGHTGGVDGFTAVVYRFTDDSLTVAYCGNGQDYPVKKIIDGALNICLNQPYILPRFGLSLDMTILKQYTGHYSSSDILMELTISADSNTLYVNRDGAAPFPLEAVSENIFRYAPDGMEMHFYPGKNEMTMEQSGQTFFFVRKS